MSLLFILFETNARRSSPIMIYYSHLANDINNCSPFERVYHLIYKWLTYWLCISLTKLIAGQEILIFKEIKDSDLPCSQTLTNVSCSEPFQSNYHIYNLFFKIIFVLLSSHLNRCVSRDLFFIFPDQNFLCISCIPLSRSVICYWFFTYVSTASV
jgi:hypothetical protein